MTIWQHPHLHVSTFTAELLWDSWNFEACFVYTGHCHCTFGWKTFWSSSIFRFIKKSFYMVFFPISGYYSWVSFHIKQPIFFSQFFPWIFLSFSSWKRKQTFYWSKTGFFLSFGLIKSMYVFFSTAQTEKNSWKK